jgi:hypothetical protein
VEHPGNNEFLEFHAPLPPDLGKLRQAFTEKAGDPGAKTVKKAIKSIIKPPET